MATIDKARLPELLTAVFSVEAPEVFEAYSELGCELETFSSAERLEEHISTQRRDGKTFLYFRMWYPSCAGRVEKKRLQLNPEACGGHTFRYEVSGWGVFQLQLDFKHDPAINCRIAVNSKKRALTWEAIYPEYGAVETWNWPAVEKHERRLTRKLRSLAQAQAPNKTP